MCIVPPRFYVGFLRATQVRRVYYNTRMGFREVFGDSCRCSRISPHWVWGSHVTVEQLAVFGWVRGTGTETEDHGGSANGLVLGVNQERLCDHLAELAPYRIDGFD